MTTDGEPFNHEPTKAHSAATASTKHDDEPTRLTTTGCASSPGQQQRGPWADGQTTHDRTIPAERPVDQLSRRKQKEGVWPPEKRVVDFFDQLQRAPPTPMSDQWGAHDIPPPSGVGKTGAVRWEIIVAPTTSTGGQGPSRWRDFGGPGDGGRGWRSRWSLVPRRGGGARAGHLE